MAAVLCGVAVGVLQRPVAELARGGLGDLIVIGGMLAFTAGVALLQRLAATVDAVVISPSIHAIGDIGLLLHAGIVTLMLVHAPRCADSVAPWVGLVLSGAFFTGIGNLLWNHGVRLIGVTRASVWLYWVPLSGVAAAVLLLGDPLMRWHLLGLALVLGGTWLGTRRAVVAVAPFEV